MVKITQEQKRALAMLTQRVRNAYHTMTPQQQYELIKKLDTMVQEIAHAYRTRRDGEKGKKG